VLGLVALSTAPVHPALPRLLSKLTNSLHPYQNEIPIGAPRPTTFLLGIFTTAREKDAVQNGLIRQSYLSIGDARICSLEEFIRQAEETPDERVCKVPYTFVIGGGGDHRPTDHGDDEPLTVDSDHHGFADPNGDCTYLNIKENMEYGKSPSWFKYAASIAKEYGIDYVGKVDNDSVISPHLLFQFIDDDLPITPFNRRIYGGLAQPSAKHSHLYGTGEFYFMSSDLADYVGHTLTAPERNELMEHVEDADMASFIFTNPNPIKFMNLRNFQLWTHPKKTAEEFSAAWDNELDVKLPARSELAWWHVCPIFMAGKGV